MSEQAPEFDGYPCFGYVYNLDGFYYAPVEIDSDTQMGNFLTRVAHPAIERGQEVRVTDRNDHLIFHAEKGEILWPNETGVPPQES